MYISAHTWAKATWPTAKKSRPANDNADTPHSIKIVTQAGNKEIFSNTKWTDGEVTKRVMVKKDEHLIVRINMNWDSFGTEAKFNDFSLVVRGNAGPDTFTLES